MRKLMMLFLALMMTIALRAQSVEVGAFLGGSLYSGDLSPKEFGVYFDEVSPAGGIFGRYNVNDIFALRLGINVGKIEGTGDTLIGTTRPSFRSSISELSLTGEISPFSIGGSGLTVKPYLFGGIAAFRFNPQTEFDGDYIDLQPLGTEGQGLEGYPARYSLTQISIPFGGGLKFIINESWAIGAELGWRKTFTDHLDDISDATVNYRDIYDGNGQLAALLSNGLIAGPEVGDVNYKRGGEFKDWYYFGGVTVSFFLDGGNSRGSLGGRKRGKVLGCPTF